MRLTELYRLDYPLYAPDEMAIEPTAYDPDLRVERQPLGLFFQFAGHGLLLELASDAAQVRWRLAALSSFLANELPRFSFVSPVLPDSELGSLLGGELRQIQFGFVKGYLPTDADTLLFGIKLHLETQALLFVNQADEGYYLFEGTAEYSQHFEWFIGFCGQPTWVEQPQLLAWLAQGRPTLL